ncbi:hypothetical protein PQ43W_5 [Ralstonia phage PQ43W]
MLKSLDVVLSGKDEGLHLRLSELPALVADRRARAALRAIGEDGTGGVITLALRHTAAALALGEPGRDLLLPFVQAEHADGRPFRLAQHLRDWRNVERLIQAALHLHVGFLFEREVLDVPVTLRAEQILAELPDVAVTFCSPHIAAVLQSHHATYVELETVLSTEDAFNLVELLNVETIREFHTHQRAKTTT